MKKKKQKLDDWLGSTSGQASSDGASQQKCPVPLLQGETVQGFIQFFS